MTMRNPALAASTASGAAAAHASPTTTSGGWIQTRDRQRRRRTLAGALCCCSGLVLLALAIGLGAGLQREADPSACGGLAPDPCEETASRDMVLSVAGGTAVDLTTSAQLGCVLRADLAAAAGVVR
jgi:hypothetical protein